MLRLFTIGALLGAWYTLANAQTAPRDPFTRTYKVEADFSQISEHHFTTQVQLDLSYEGAQPIQDLTFILYPGRYRRELPHLNDLNFHRVYPHGVSRGDMEIEAVGVKSAPTQPLAFSRTSDTEMVVHLAQPLVRGQRLVLEITSKVTIPEKFGPFGHYRGRTTLTGGWTPYLASFVEGQGFRSTDGPPLAHWLIKGQTRENLLIGDALVEVRENQVTSFERELANARTVSLWFSPEVHSEIMTGRNLRVEVLTFEKYRPLSQRFRELVQKWMDFVERQDKLPTVGEPLIMVEAPLRRKLAVRGTPYGYFSDRTFKVIRPLQQYHAIPLVHALFYQWFYPRVNLRENARDVHWVTDALAWRWTERFVQEYQYAHIDARTIPMVRAMSFLFTVDRVIYTPQFAFYDVFYDYVYPVDEVRDDPLLFNHERPFGRTVYAHMEDELSPEVANRITEAYFATPSLPFQAVAQTQTNEDVAALLDQWLKPRPAVNYVLRAHRETRASTGYEQEVEVERVTPEPFAEPVELLAQTEDGKREWLRWKGTENRHIYRFRTAEPVDLLEIDPRRRLWETTLADNRVPPKYKFVVTEYVWTYDFNNNEPTISVAGTFRRSYGGSNRYNLSAGYFGDAYGGSVGYSRLFGRVVDSLRLSHGAGLGFSVQRLDNEWVLVQDPATSLPAAVETGQKSFVTALSASYFFGDQLSLTNPMRGGGASLSATWGTKYLGGDASYYRFNLSGSWIFPLHPNHLLAVRGFLGHSGREEIPTQIQYGLGGLNGMKGLSLDDDRFKGRNIFLLGAEYRHFLFTDLDVDFFVFQIRKIQGALFANAGQVTDTVLEKAERQALGVQKQGTFLDLFDPRDFQSDVGYGVRLFIDYLGVSPSLLTFDVAKSLTESGSQVRFYFGVTQSF